jgi:hypothetical protein
MSLVLPDERLVPAPLSDALLRELEDVRVGDFGSTWLRVDGIATFDRNSKLQQFEEVQAIERLDAADPSVQLETLRRLRDGWLDGAGVAPPEGLLHRVRDWFNEHLTDDTPLPRLFPTPEGGVEAEWVIDRQDVSLEFDPQAQRVEWHALDLDTRAVEERTVSLSDADGLRDLGQHMVAFLERPIAGTDSRR